MFDYQRLLKKLSHFEEMGKSKQSRMIEDLMTDRDFAIFLYQPEDVANLTEVVNQMYGGLAKVPVLKALIRYVEEEGYDEFTKTQACFFYAIVTLALESANELSEEISKKRKDGDITHREYDEQNAKVEDYIKLVKRLFKAAKKIVKPDAKELANKTDLPFELAKISCLMVPNKQYIDRNRIGNFLYLLLSEWYDNIDDVGYQVAWSTIDWKEVFKELFGKDRLAEVATYLLLEGHNRRDSKCSAPMAGKLWDSLTEFALQQMNDSPEQIRDQMIELYLKKVSRMFTNGTYELRVDLLSIPEVNGSKSLTNLTKSILKYKDKLKEVFKKL